VAKSAKKLNKKVNKLEKRSAQLRQQAEKQGRSLQTLAAGDDADKGGKKGFFTFLLAAGAAIAVALKKKRDQELDEALWEEPRSI
jgi:ribosomal protein L9